MSRNKENAKRWLKEYRKKNLEKIRKREKEYYYKNIEKKREQRRNYYWRNCEKLKIKRRKYREKNKELIRKKEKERYHNDIKGRRTKMLEAKRKTYRKLRFSILLRDDFTCKYCGRKPPEVILEIDHIFPKSKGGKNKLDNYVVACRDCNQGKSDILL